MIKLTTKFMALGAGSLALISLFSPAARATDLLVDPADVFSTSAPTQLGRISRNGVQQTWTPADNGETAYPGSINPATTYNYETFTFTAAQLGNGKYVEISFEEPNGANDLFASAWTTYQGTTSVASGAGWLGDAGSSRDYAFTSIPPTPQDPRFFDVTVPSGSGLTVVINTSAASALGETFGLEVQAFSSTEYADLAAVPEPSSWAMMFLGLGVVAVPAVRMARRQRA